MSITQQIRTTLASAEAMSTKELAEALSWDQLEKKNAAAVICNMRKSLELVTRIEEGVAKHSLVAGFRKTAPAAAPIAKPNPAQPTPKELVNAVAAGKKNVTPLPAERALPTGDIPPLPLSGDKFDGDPNEMRLPADTVTKALAATKAPAGPVTPATLAAPPRNGTIEQRCHGLAIGMRELMQDAIDAGWQGIHLQVLYQASTRIGDLSATLAATRLTP